MTSNNLTSHVIVYCLARVWHAESQRHYKFFDADLAQLKVSWLEKAADVALL